MIWTVYIYVYVMIASSRRYYKIFAFINNYNKENAAIWLKKKIIIIIIMQTPSLLNYYYYYCKGLINNNNNTIQFIDLRN